jgi:hypothetical protein
LPATTSKFTCIAGPIDSISQLNRYRNVEKLKTVSDSRLIHRQLEYKLEELAVTYAASRLFHTQSL